MKVYLNEVFTSIEGEGIYIGTKTLFIRFAGCPLRCFWCDTPYALSLNDGKAYDIDDAKRLIDSSIKANTYKVNFTGGEPLLQYKALYALAEHVKSKGLKTYLESSCYDSRRFEYVLPMIDICKVEFKLKDSDAVKDSMHDLLIKEALRCLRLAIDNKRSTYIKIVVSNRSNMEEIKILTYEIFKSINGGEIDGFVIQPVYGDAKPSMDKLLSIYDEVYKYYREVRIIPQIQKVMNIP